MPSNDKLQFGMIGLGRMGAGMVRRLMKSGHPCVVYDRSADAVAALVKDGATSSSSLAEFVKKLEKPRHLCLMVPAAYVDSSIGELEPLLEKGDTFFERFASRGLDLFQNKVQSAMRFGFGGHVEKK
jgi:6-phosphogluconate dehydrogenase